MHIVGLVGLACIIAAVVGGGIEMYVGKFPPLASVKRQALLAFVGFILLVLGFYRHEIEYCTTWKDTRYSGDNPPLNYNVADAEAERVLTASVDTALDRPGGGQINVDIKLLPSEADAKEKTGAVGSCVAQADTTSNGKCRAHVVVSTTLLHWGDGSCQMPPPVVAPR